MRIGKWIAKNRILILIAGILLIVPSLIGLAVTKVNYDLLSYLPETRKKRLNRSTMSKRCSGTGRLRIYPSRQTCCRNASEMPCLTGMPPC